MLTESKAWMPAAPLLYIHMYTPTHPQPNIITLIRTHARTHARKLSLSLSLSLSRTHARTNANTHTLSLSLSLSLSRARALSLSHQIDHLSGGLGAVRHLIYQFFVHLVCMIYQFFVHLVCMGGGGGSQIIWHSTHTHTHTYTNTFPCI